MCERAFCLPSRNKSRFHPVFTLAKHHPSPLFPTLPSSFQGSVSEDDDPGSAPGTPRDNNNDSGGGSGGDGTADANADPYAGLDLVVELNEEGQEVVVVSSVHVCCMRVCLRVFRRSVTDCDRHGCWFIPPSTPRFLPSSLHRFVLLPRSKLIGRNASSADSAPG